MQPLSAPGGRGGGGALQRDTSHRFIYLEVQLPDNLFQGSILKTLKSLGPFWISDLQVFLSWLCVRCVCACEVSIAQAAQTPPSSLICACVFVGGGPGGEGARGGEKLKRVPGIY